MGGKRVFKTNVFDLPDNEDVKCTIERQYKNRCPNCDHIHSIGKLGVGTNLEVKCAKCKLFFYLRQV